MKHFIQSSLVCAILVALLFSSCNSVVRRKTEVSIVGAEFYLNGRPTFEGQKWRNINIQGLLPNARLVNGIFDDKNDSTSYKWAYPDTKEWDPDRNTREFVSNMTTWKEHGLMAFTINLQGGSPEGYSQTQPWDNSAILPNGSLDERYMKRLEHILDKADELGMVVILGVFYVGQEKNLQDSTVVRKAIKNTVTWVLRHAYRNVLLEINNECDFFQLDGLSPATVHSSIAYAKTIKRHGRRLLVGTSYAGGIVPSNSVIAVSDFILLHGNGISNPDDITKQVNAVRESPVYIPKPIVYNEDDHFNFDMEENNFMKATKAYASWGFFDYRQKGESYEQGFQSVPVDWGIHSERKKGFFHLIAEWQDMQ